MIRKIALLVGSFAVLLAGFWIYRTLAGVSWPGQSPGGVEAPEIPSDPGGDEDAGGPEVIVRDEQGAIEAVYRAAKVRREEDGSFTLTDPNFEVHVSDGQIVYLTAEEANVIGEEVAGGVRPHSGRMSRNVRIDIDRKPRAMPRDRRPREIIRIRLEDITFDNQLLTLESSGRVVVWSLEADIVGTGFYMSWNEKPRELRKLRIDRGQYMAVKQLKDDLDMVFLPGGRGRKPEPASRKDGPEQTPAAEGESEEKPEGQARVAVDDRESPGQDRQDAAEADEEGEASEPVRPARNIYQAVLSDNVQVFSGVRSMRGASELTLRFQWEGEVETAVQDAPEPGSASGPGPSEEPDAPAGGPDAPQPGGEPGSTAPQPDSPQVETAPSGAGDEPSEPLMIYWTGPLVLTPTGHTAEPDSKDYRISAKGRQVVLSDGEAKAYCRSFYFSNPTRVGKLSVPAGDLVRLVLRDGQTIESPEVRFDLVNEMAFFDGPGRMVSPAGQGRRFISTPSRDVGAEDVPRGSLGQDELRWSESMEATFRDPQPGEAVARDEQMLDRATFEGEVELFTAAGDYVLCDEQLDVRMTLGADGRAYPRLVTATGDAWASWEESILEAQSIQVHFKEVPVTAADGAETMEVRASRIQASREVYVASLMSDDSVFEARCNELDSDLLVRSATLTGDPARTRSGSDELLARRIFVQRQVAVDTGREGMDLYAQGDCRLLFTTDRDMSGNRLSEPRPVEIASGSLEFRSLFDTAKFGGGVTMTSRIVRATEDDPRTRQSETLEAESMRILFMEDEPDTREGDEDQEQDQEPAAEATEPDDGDSQTDEPARPLALDMGAYSGRKIGVIIADGGVNVVSRQADTGGRTLLKLTAKGEQLTYDTTIRQMTMSDRGRLLLEDYRPSRVAEAREQRADDGTLTGSITAPSQTVFAWTRSMTLKQAKREVILEGDVRMAHVSGNEVVYADRLSAPDWGELDSGKRLDLRRADVLIAQFAEAGEQDGEAGGEGEEPGESAGSGDELREPELGMLKSLTARGNVLLEDETTSVVAERLTYVRPLKMVTILGHLPGEPAKSALLTRVDPETRRESTFEGTQILWYLQNDHVQVKGARAGGVR